MSLSHVGLFYHNIEETVRFYRDVLGLAVSDFGGRAYLGGVSRSSIVFVRAGTEHHCVSLFPDDMKIETDDTHMQHAAWNIRTYSELIKAIDFITERGHKLEFVARRAPGRNYCTYFLDPENNRIELAFNLEQVGWQGTPSPTEFWEKFLIEGALPKPPVRQPEEEIEDLRRKFDNFGGSKVTYSLEKAYEILPLPPDTRRFDTSGERSPRPFKIERIGYYALRCRDLDSQHLFYQEVMGLRTVRHTTNGVLMSVGLGNNVDLKLFEKEGGYQSRLQKVCFEVRSYEELSSATKHLKGIGIEVTHEGRGETYQVHNELCVDFEDPSGNPIRLSFTPDAKGIRETDTSVNRGAGLPPTIECE